MKRIFSLTIALFLFVNCMYILGQSDTKEWTADQTKKWFKEKAWLGGLKLEPHQTIDRTEFARQYRLNKVYWDKAFAFLKEHDLQTLPNGRYPIDGENVFALITLNPTKEYDSTLWESHRNYIDLHCVATGEEKIGVYPISRLKVFRSYDASKDVTNYSGTGKIYTAVRGTFFIFFPSDGHRPGVSPGGNKKDKKIVIKIRYAH